MRRQRAAWTTLGSALALAAPSLAQQPANDILLLTDALAEHRLCIGSGEGQFDCHDEELVFGSPMYGVAAPLDGDSSLDLLLSGYQVPLATCLGTAAGAFEPCAVLDTAHNRQTSVAVGDIDRDGNLDAFFSVWVPGIDPEHHHFCHGNGDGSLGPCIDLADEPFWAYDAALGDLNEDGNLDVILATRYDHEKVCLGNGDGTFQPCSDIALGFYSSRDVEIADLNADSHLDAVFASEDPFPPTGTPPRNRVCLGDGTGGFTCSTIGTDELDTYSVHLAYLDDDAHLDAIFGNPGQRPTTCLGRGDGTFDPCFGSIEFPHQVEAVAIGLLDGDEHVDLVMSDFNGTHLCPGDGNGFFPGCQLFEAETGLVIVVAEFGGPFIFADGFESGDTSAWAASVP